MITIRAHGRGQIRVPGFGVAPTSRTCAFDVGQKQGWEAWRREDSEYGRGGRRQVRSGTHPLATRDTRTRRVLIRTHLQTLGEREGPHMTVWARLGEAHHVSNGETEPEVGCILRVFSESRGTYVW